MTIDDTLRQRLSAYLDGELPPAEMEDIEEMVARLPEVAREFEALSRLDAGLKSGFEAELDEPVPAALLAAIDVPEAPVAPAPANLPHPPMRWLGQLAAGFALIVLGAAGGIGYARMTAPPVEVAAAGWLDQVAEYHVVYAAQTKHLVEVPASDPTLAAWLAKSTGVEAMIPDLSDKGLTFQGGRLLVAAGKPVAQLMYTDAEGQVIAICYVAGGDATLADGRSEFKSREFDGFHMIWWRDDHAAYVVIGPDSRQDLPQIAETTSTEL